MRSAPRRRSNSTATAFPPVSASGRRSCACSTGRIPAIATEGGAASKTQQVPERQWPGQDGGQRVDEDEKLAAPGKVADIDVIGGMREAGGPDREIKQHQGDDRFHAAFDTSLREVAIILGSG